MNTIKPSEAVRAKMWANNEKLKQDERDLRERRRSASLYCEARRDAGEPLTYADQSMIERELFGIGGFDGFMQNEEL